MVRVVRGDVVAPHERAREDEPDAALLEHVRDAVAAAGLEPRVGGLGEAEGVDEVEGRLRGVPHVHLHVVDAVDRHPVVLLDGHLDRARAGAGPEITCSVAIT